MLRSLEQLRKPSDAASLIAADDEHMALIGGGKDYAVPWHWHDGYMVMIPSSGVIELSHEGQPRGLWLSQDRFILVPPDRAHTTRAGMGASAHLALYAAPDALLRLVDTIGSRAAFRRRAGAPVQIARTSAVRAIQALLMRKDLGESNSSVRRKLSSALLTQCITDVFVGMPLSTATPQNHGAALVEDIRSFVRLHAERDIPLDQLAQHFGLSRRHLTRLFRDATGLSIGQFQQEMRIENAVRLLRETDLPVGEIAYRIGFESSAALARAMRRLLDQSPSDVRAGVARSVKG